MEGTTIKFDRKQFDDIWNDFDKNIEVKSKEWCKEIEELKPHRDSLLTKTTKATKNFFNKLEDKIDNKMDAWVDYNIEHPIASKIIWFTWFFAGFTIRYYICKKTNRSFITGFKKK